ncbi:MAG: hypothetical protein IT292_08655 [Deltaproteobacteria bacterium]|nr:hypothetical protein [Deltaproteobacteria bacterium]
MARAYTPALTVSAKTKITRLRELPLPGKALVKLGDEVSSEQAVLSAELPGEVEILKLLERSGLDLEAVKKSLLVKVGDSVSRGQTILSAKSFFGLFCTELTAPIDSQVEFFNQVNGHLGIRGSARPINISAYLSGKVVGIEEGKALNIEASAAWIQGVFGVGGERFGEVLVLSLPNDALVDKQDLQKITSDLKGKILVGGRGYSIEALREAQHLGVSAILTGSVNSQTLKEFLGYDIGVAITGDENIPFTFIVTEGFGELAISERVMTLAKKLVGKKGCVNGTTQVRAGAMRPELIVCSAGLEETQSVGSLELKVGATVRIVRTPYFGQLATVVQLPTELEKVQSGAIVRVLQVQLADGRLEVVPRANVELV